MTDIQTLEKELENKEKELSKTKNQLKILKEEKNTKEKAEKYFEKHFGLSSISDDYNCYPSEYYSQIMCRFIENFCTNDTDEYNEYRLSQLRTEYIDFLKNDIKQLQDELEILESEMKEIETNKQ